MSQFQEKRGSNKIYDGPVVIEINNSAIEDVGYNVCKREVKPNRKIVNKKRVDLPLEKWISLEKIKKIKAAEKTYYYRFGEFYPGGCSFVH